MPINIFGNMWENTWEKDGEKNYIYIYIAMNYSLWLLPINIWILVIVIVNNIVIAYKMVIAKAGWWFIASPLKNMSSSVGMMT